jgi:hypothetical protein
MYKEDAEYMGLRKLLHRNHDKHDFFNVNERARDQNSIRKLKIEKINLVGTIKVDIPCRFPFEFFHSRGILISIEVKLPRLAAGMNCVAVLDILPAAIPLYFTFNEP